MEFLQGKKSYLVALAAVVWAVYNVWTGSMTVDVAVNYVLGGGALMSVKSALEKVGI
ncbi:MAG: hypothetical protein ACUZ8I_15015 [Candidatus Scalindua sp.]